jgi:sporulation protein YabP
MLSAGNQRDELMSNMNESTENINSILIKNRNFLEMHGVQRVEDFDNEEIHLDTNRGALIIRGRDLHIAQLLLEKEELSVEGEIDSLSFEEGKARQKKQGSFLKRITK